MHAIETIAMMHLMWILQWFPVQQAETMEINGHDVCLTANGIMSLDVPSWVTTDHSKMVYDPPSSLQLLTFT